MCAKCSCNLSADNASVIFDHVKVNAIYSDIVDQCHCRTSSVLLNVLLFRFSCLFVISRYLSFEVKIMLYIKRKNITPDSPSVLLLLVCFALQNTNKVITFILFPTHADMIQLVNVGLIVSLKHTQ